MSKKKLTKKERALGRLERVHRKLDPEDKEFAEDLLWKYRVHGYLTDKQWHWLMKLAEPKRIPKKEIKGDHWLYAIVAGHKVKLGYTKDPKGRLKSIQVGNPNKADIRWTLEAGDENEAKLREKKLHRFCKQFHIRGEWFDIQCLALVKSFK